ncbi:MAG TPA: hypothetical protein VEG08_03325 [Terriglobales bacterium]|nr:hypothetical protein [Terriglobales bacterium]
MATLAVRQAEAPRTTPRLAAGALALLLLVGLYSPTSIAEQFSPLLYAIGYVACFALLLVLAVSARRRPGAVASMVAGSIVPLLLFFTSISGLATYTYGALPGYVVLSLLLLLRLPDIALPGWLSGLYVLLNVLNLAACSAILAGSEWMQAVLVTHYSVFYPDLVANMLLLRMPVLTFGTHSLAGFFLYLFFYAAFQTYRLKQRRLFLVFAVCYVVLTLALLSVTGVVLASLAMVQMAHHFWSSSRHRWLWAAGVMAVACIVAIVVPVGPLFQSGRDLVLSAQDIVADPGAGFLGRLMPSGTLHYDLQYLQEHPLQPVGVSYREGLMLGDSGVLEYLLRGSVILVLLVYGGFFLFLRRNLVAKTDLYLLFLVTLAFETGFTVLTYSRTLCLLPFLVVYLNGLRRPSAAGVAPIP